MAQGQIQVNAYASNARIPLKDVAVTIADAGGSALAMRLTNRSGQFDEPLTIEVPDKSESLNPNPGLIPYMTVNLYARKENYEVIFVKNLQVFADALKSSRNSICYNGNIFNVSDYETFSKNFPEVDKVMLGRGAICNPALAAEILGKGTMSKEVLREFHNRIYAEYKQMYSGEKNILFRMKELWCYMIFLFQEKDKHQKKVMKSKNLLEYEAAITALFRECEVDSSIGFRPL